jgi:FkbM family methyltransferase
MPLRTQASLTELQAVGLKLLARARPRPRRVPLVLPRCVFHTGGQSVANLYDAIFCDRLYESPTPLPAAPRIVDAGGHLGMASLYFLTRYPANRVLTIEANPSLVELLRENLAPWAGRNQIVAAALATHAGSTTFYVDADNPFTVTGGIENRERPDLRVQQIEVPCVDAAQLLREPIDLMKLDVEGHEYALLQLELFRPSHVKNLVIEFHEVDAPRERFARTLALLAQRGYRVANDAGTQVTREDLAQSSGCVVLKLF